MLFDPTRHEPLRAGPWDEDAARAAIARIVAATEAGAGSEPYWPVHANDLEPGANPASPSTTLYFGACGVLWALQYLQAVGAATLSRDPLTGLDALLEHNRDWLAASTPEPLRERASYFMGDVPILMLGIDRGDRSTKVAKLAALIDGNVDHPSRELMWGSPGTLLAAWHLHAHTGDPRWSGLFRRTADRLWDQLAWSDEHACAYWMQDLYGHHTSYIGAVHGFVGTALPLIKGRHLFDPDRWTRWAEVIANTVRRTARVEGDAANWRALLDEPARARPRALLMQYCHGAPGFVVNLADFPDDSLDDLLLAAGEAVWSAGPLAKGANLCHGTGGNGYAFLKLHRRTGDARWLARARAFAMHGIGQVESDLRRHGQYRHSLWTGDPGFAIYLWDCITGGSGFPTLDVYLG